jgi:predicted nucleic acid-binding Zn ribbon protein
MIEAMGGMLMFFILILCVSLMLWLSLEGR